MSAMRADPLLLTPAYNQHFVCGHDMSLWPATLKLHLPILISILIHGVYLPVAMSLLVWFGHCAPDCLLPIGYATTNFFKELTN